MNTRIRWIVLVAALALPVAVWAQRRAAPVQPSIAVARPALPATADSPAPDDDDESIDELMELGFADDLMAFAGAPGEGPDDGPPMHRMGRRHGMGRGPGGGLMGHGMRGRLAELDLTDDQRTKLQSLHEAQARKSVQRRADMQLARIDLHKLMREDRPNMASVNSQIDKLARLHAENLKARFETHMQARALLTPEQVKKLRQGMPGMHHEPGDFD